LDLPDDASQVSNWQELYEDPILDRYLAKALSDNFDLRIARTRLRESVASLQRSSSLLKPRINASTSASGVAVVGTLDEIFDSYGIGSSGSWDPDIFGQTKAGIDQSRANLAAQEALTEGTRQSILAQTARAYIRVVEAELQVQLAKTNLDFLTESRRISEARYRVGDTAKGDFSFAEANYQNALAGFENTKQAARAAKRALSVLLGDYPVDTLELAVDLGLPKLLPPRGLPSRVLERRPDIVAARANVVGRAASLRSNQLNDWPSLSLTGSLNSASRFEDLFDPADYIARLGAVLVGNILDGGSNQAAIEGARASLDGSLLSYEAVLRDAMREISDAYDRADNLRRTLVNLQAASDAANEALRLESIQYDLGESSLLDVLQVQTRVNSIDATLIRTKAALLETTITAYQAIGGFTVAN
jgi:NodT family efflux transporter outer membrane factor (OMF) lipoprotein